MARSGDHVDNFFAYYTNFKHDRSNDIWDEFYRMCDQFGWRKHNPKREVARERLKAAMISLFNEMYGEDVNDISAWHNLCRILNIHPPPQNLNACRRRVKRTHVNLVDLVQDPRNGARVRVFPNVKTLREYTIEERKFFPKDDAIAGGVLKYLLRDILRPR